MSGELVATGVETLTTTAESMLALFQIWPLNIAVIAGIAAISFGLVRGFIPKKRAR